ncbi:hypothetical protein KVR01_013275 [Diaporthe batatas]|uniref:uncharacterized protein n=1 Tax=Diaporthe batatas TaxID=748121 RepID=UPI001D03AA78|nr:uncharacterized protein KVR01_013275 [Diaporthe batatas]KAG8156862.1 hypothetical protein KVR01_013275 [Diaporthe batatas]
MESASYISSNENAAFTHIPAQLPFVDDMFHESVAKWPDNIALVCAHQDPDLYDIPSVATPSLQGVDGTRPEENRRYLRWTFENLKSGVDRLKVGLTSLGVRRGMAVVTFMPNCAEYVLTWWATRGMGLVMAPINPRNLSNKEEVAHMIATIMKGTGEQPPILVAFESEHLESEPLKNVQAFAKIVVSSPSSQSPTENVLFGDLMSSGDKNGNATQIGCQHNQQPTDDEILFTSGTSSRPKGVKIEHPILSLGMYNFANTPGCEPRPGDLWLALTPNNHGMGRGTLTSSMCFGGGTVYPSYYFDAQDAADALLRERCTHAALVPTLVRLLADSVGLRLRTAATDRSLLRTIFLSGAPPTRADMQECVDILGIQSISSVYGMTEGAEASSPACSDWMKLFNEEGMLSVGIPRSRGAAIKICAPDATGPDRPPLPLGTPGEIHYHGPERHPRSAIYIGKPDADNSTYTDGQGRRWFVTGDRGVVVVADGKQLYIMGRCKDMIVRGGENIAPAAIESCLADNPALGSLSIQIVGTPDAIAGEVPVAVVATRSENLRDVADEIHHTILQKMGPIFLPSQVIPLAALGITEWPRTLTGKIRKAEVADLVNKLIRSSDKDVDEGRTPPKSGHVANEVLGIWARSIGLTETSLTTHQPLSEFADSLTIARVIRRIKRNIPGCGSLSAQQLAQCETIQAQIDLAVREAREQGDAHNGKGAKTSRVYPSDQLGPPGIEDMVHLTEQPNLFDRTKKLVLNTISQHEFGWDDVEDIFPAQACVSELARSGVIDSARFHFVDLMTAESDVERVKQAVQTMLCNNRILASFVVWDQEGQSDLERELALHVTLRHGEKLFDRVIQVAGAVKTVEDLQQLAINCPEPDRALLPGINFRALIYTVEETSTVGLLYIDASSIWMFQEDLECILSAQQVPPHVNYKVWADMYYSFRSSPQARSAVDWHAKYLSGIGNHLDRAPWPPIPHRGPLDPTGRNYPAGIQYSFQAPNLGALRRQYPGLSAPVILKSALALLNVWHTGHTHAIFSSCEDGRTKWPFMPAFRRTQNDGPPDGGLFNDAQDVAGPTIQFVTNLVEVRPSETVVDFLHRMQDDQVNLTRHAHAPWPEVEQAAGMERGTIRRIFTTMKFNWVPGFGAQAQTEKSKEPFQNFKILAAVARWRIGALCRLGLGGSQNDTVVMHLMGDALSGEQKVHLAKR